MYGIVRQTCRSAWLQQELRHFHNSHSKYNAKKSHYAALGITPKATQADVKAAYYKLTKIYHPDRQQGTPNSEENTQKFRDVTAAYEVLGNVKLRRLYDKGMYHRVASTTAPGAWRSPVEEDEDPKMKFYRSREVRSRPPPPAGGIPVYDFNEWSKQHYGATFMRDQTIKRNREKRAAFASATVNDIKVERVLFVLCVFVFSWMVLTADSLRSPDNVVYKKEENTKGTNT